tara:strand:+ start:547 stop:741 length:195 start_codon:yes stop_codon:yes gene_type:complete
LKKIKLKKKIKYSICTCGLSKKMPFCDNKHRTYNSKNNTNYKSLKIESDKDVIINISSSTWNNN